MSKSQIIEMIEAEWRDRLIAAVLAEREACAHFIEHEYVRQFERPWRVDLSAAIRARGDKHD